jgi:hypothetical protein
MILSLLLATASAHPATQRLHYVDLDLETFFPVTRKTLVNTVSEMDAGAFNEIVAVINRYVRDTKPKVAENRMRIMFLFNDKPYAIDAEGNLEVGNKGGCLERPVRDHVNRFLRKNSHVVDGTK